MLDILVWNKYSRIIHKLAIHLNISDMQALEMFYHSRVYQVLSDKDNQLITVSDQYIVDELIKELHADKSEERHF
ncbi:MAG: DUF3791 domain-containing protein [Bacteroidaceae bacterium]|nr:DUF3791 domain-containing protein [Bacteroidaceae bacterium]